MCNIFVNPNADNADLCDKYFLIFFLKKIVNKYHDEPDDIVVAVVVAIVNESC